MLKSASSTVGRVADAGGVAKERIKPLAVLSLPVVLLASALAPVAVLLLPVVLLKSAPTPVAVLMLPVGVAIERINTVGRVVVAGGVVIRAHSNRWPCCRRRWCC